jgi:GAF domain-containing protein
MYILQKGNPRFPMPNAGQTTKQLFQGLADLRKRIADMDRTERDEQQSLKAELEKTRKALETRMAERTAANERLKAEIIQRTQAEQHLATQVARLQTLTRLNQLISSSLEMDHLLQEIARAASRLMNMSIVTFWIVDERSHTVEARAFSDERVSEDLSLKKLRFDQEGVGWVATHRRALHVPDIFEDARFIRCQWWRAHKLKSFFGLPVMHEDALLAVLAFSGQHPFRLGAPDRYLLENFVAQAAIAIRTAQLFRESDKQRRHWATLGDVAQRMTRSLNLPTVLNAIVEAAALAFEGEVGFRLLQGEFLIRVGATPGARDTMRQKRIRIGESLSGRVAATGKGMVTPDGMTDPRIIPAHRAAFQAAHTGALMCVPVGLGSRVLGTLHIYRERGHHFDQDARRLATSLANQAAIAIENVRLCQQVQRQADKLTQANDALHQYIAERKQVTEALGSLGAKPPQ